MLYNVSKVIYNIDTMQDTGHVDVEDSEPSFIKPRYAGVFNRLELQYTKHSDISDGKRGHTAVYCNYEDGEWNYRQFITWISKHLPSFALNSKEIKQLKDTTAIEQIERAVGNVYSERHISENRGEIGELILHGLITDIYGTIPLISKIYRKTAMGDTVKGADCVHFIELDGKLDSLWLGESKFKKDPTSGIREAVASITEMIDSLANWEEFIVIRQHLDDEIPISKEVEKLLSRASSLNDIKAKICVPVLVTYNSKVTAAHTEHSKQFVEELNKEIEPYISSFLTKTTGIKEVDIHVFFMPIKSKDNLIKIFDRFLASKRAISYEI